MDILFYHNIEIISMFQYLYFPLEIFPMGFFPISPDGIFFPRDFFPTGKIHLGFFKNSFNCVNSVFICSEQHYLYFVAFAHQLLYTILTISTVPCKLKGENGQQEKGKY